MFDFVSAPLAPGTQTTDTHHLGVQLHNATLHEARVVLTLGPARIHLPLPPGGIVSIYDEASQRIVIENLSSSYVGVEWMKTRDRAEL